MMILGDAPYVNPTMFFNLTPVFSISSTVPLISSTMSPGNALNAYLDTSPFKESAEGLIKIVLAGVTLNVCNALPNINSILISMFVFKDHKDVYNLTILLISVRHAIKIITISEEDASLNPPLIMAANKKASMRGNLNVKCV